MMEVPRSASSNLSSASAWTEVTGGLVPPPSFERGNLRSCIRLGVELDTAPIVGVHRGLSPHVFGNWCFTLRHHQDSLLILSLAWDPSTQHLGVVRGLGGGGRRRDSLFIADGSSDPSEEEDSAMLDWARLQVHDPTH